MKRCRWCNREHDTKGDRLCPRCRERCNKGGKKPSTDAMDRRYPAVRDGQAAMTPDTGPTNLDEYREAYWPLLAQRNRLVDRLRYRCPECRKGNTTVRQVGQGDPHWYHGGPGSWIACQLNDDDRAALVETRGVR